MFIPVEQLPAVNATLNFLATVLLLSGYVLIKRRQELAHKWTMLAAFGVSIAFLVCYLIYHWQIGGGKHFQGPPVVKTLYLAMLLTHIILAMTVPFLTVATIITGFKDRRAAHRRLARWTFPIWLYVSVTGVLIYLCLYIFFPGTQESPKIEESRTASRSNVGAQSHESP